MSAVDIIVIGAGVNGLTAACRLAQNGKRVVVVETRDRVGGLAATDEFHPGYRAPGILHDTRGVRPAVVRALGLDKHGLKLHPQGTDVLALGNDGRALAIPGERAAAARSIGGADGEKYGEWLAFVDRLRPAVERVFDAPPLDVVHVDKTPVWQLARLGLDVRRLGRRDLMELLRIPPMCVADWIEEWFEDDLLKAALALPAIAGTWTGPWSPGTAANLLVREATGGGGVVGGPAALVTALEAAARAANVDVRLGSAVERIDVASNAACGVALGDGSTIAAKTVVASCDPRQALLGLLPRGAVAHRLERRLANYRCRGTTAHVALALDRAVAFSGAPEGAFAYARTGSHLDDLERAFDAVKYRRCSSTPALEIHLPTVEDPSCAPAGHAVASILVHFAPYELEGGWTGEARDAIGDRVLAVLERHVPGIGDTVVARRVLSPVDLESELGLTGGQVHHGEHALDQLLVRPVPECFDYRTPVDGLFLCGGGTHPGGGLTCAPGYLAASAI